MNPLRVGKAIALPKDSSSDCGRTTCEGFVVYRDLIAGESNNSSPAIYGSAFCEMEWRKNIRRLCFP